MTRFAFVALCCALGWGCSSGAPTLSMSVVAPGGGSPLPGTDVDHVAVRVRQGDDAGVTSADAGVSNGTFALDVALSDPSAMVHLDVTLAGATTTLHGAPPPFVPSEGSTVRIPVARPGTCAVVGGVQLDVAREDVAAVRSRTFALVVGSGATAGFVDLLQLRSVSATLALPSAPTSARALSLDEGRALVLGTGGAFLVAPTETPRTAAVILHVGAGERSALAGLAAGGGAVVGGENSPLITVLDARGATTRTFSLRHARTAPAAQYLGDVLLVAGGADAPAELVSPDGALAEVLFADGLRSGPHLAVDRATNAALLFGGTDASGTPRTDSVALRACPPCTAAPGPPIATTAAFVPFTGGGFAAGGSDTPSTTAVWISFEADGAPHLDVTTLAVARAHPALVALPSGVVYVLGGSDASGPRRDLEVCVPPSLVPP